MLTFSRLGKKGNLGNQMFQIASTMGIASRNSQDYGFPSWKYSEYFETPIPHIPSGLEFKDVREQTFAYHEWPVKSGNFDLNGWLQTEKYFRNIIDVKALFSIKPEIEKAALAKFGHLFEKKTILISVRRGDFVNHPNYFQLSYAYYFMALTTFFKDWQTYNIVFTSDDIAYCKHHFSFLENGFFLENLSPIEQLALAQRCDHFIISNSTFSWWAAWLGEKPTSIIVRPERNFSVNMPEKFDEKDYFPSRWTVFSEKGKSVRKKYPALFIKGELYEIIARLKYLKKRGIFRFKKVIKKAIGRK